MNRWNEIFAAHTDATIALDQLKGSYASHVLLFQCAFDQPCHKMTDNIPAETYHLARKLMLEEIREMWAGFDKLQHAGGTPSLENLVEFADGAIDAIYVICWTLNKLGLPADKLFAEVQRSNMAKLQPDGTCLKNEAGKVQKPAGWTPPDLHKVLVEHRDAGVYEGNKRKDA